MQVLKVKGTAGKSLSVHKRQLQTTISPKLLA